MQVTGIAAAVVLSTTALGPQSPTELPLVVLDRQVGTRESMPADGVAKFDLRNDSTKTILAYGLKFDVILPDGTREPHGFSIDSAHTEPAYRTSEIAPRAHATADGGVLVSPAATLGNVRITFIIFDDDTAVGDEQEIGRIFERRRQRPPFWHRMDAIFSEATLQEGDLLCPQPQPQPQSSVPSPTPLPPALCPRQ